MYFLTYPCLFVNRERPVLKGKNSWVSICRIFWKALAMASSILCCLMDGVDGWPAGDLFSLPSSWPEGLLLYLLSSCLIGKDCPYHSSKLLLMFMFAVVFHSPGSTGALLYCGSETVRSKLGNVWVLAVAGWLISWLWWCSYGHGL